MIKLKDIIEGKYDVYSAKEFTFITYGGLSLTKQRGYGVKDTFHAPPSRKGIYAFVWPYIERFLLGGYQHPKERGKRTRNRIQYVRDKEGNIINSKHPDFDKLTFISNKIWHMQTWKDPKGYQQDSLPIDDDYISPDGLVLYKHIGRKKFKYNGPIWHHLKDGVKQFEILDEKGTWVKTEMDVFIREFKKRAIKSERSILSRGGPYSMDDMEVFISDKI